MTEKQRAKQLARTAYILGMHEFEYKGQHLLHIIKTARIDSLLLGDIMKYTNSNTLGDLYRNIGSARKIILNNIDSKEELDTWMRKNRYGAIKGQKILNALPRPDYERV